jgi:hypothetical protein
MTIKQKIWMWVFIAMFAVPEILWSPVANFYYEFLQSSWTSYVKHFRYNFLQNSDNLNYFKFVIFLQLIGLIGSLILMLKDKNNKNKMLTYSLATLLSIFAIAVGFILYFAMSFSIDVM